MHTRGIFFSHFTYILRMNVFIAGKKRMAEDRIKALGGEVLTSSKFEPRCTHVVSARPATTGDCTPQVLDGQGHFSAKSMLIMSMIADL